MRSPCIPHRGGCLSALLYGAACCRSGWCGCCRAEAELRELHGHESDVRPRVRLSRCPICGHRPPAPVYDVAFAHVRIIDGPQSIAPGCRVCGSALTGQRRRVCSDECRIEWRRRSEGHGDRRLTPARRSHR